MTATVTTTRTLDDAELVTATYLLTTRAEQFPELRKAEAQARLQLAAAITAMDEVEDRIEAGHALHSLHEQAAVERAKDVYAQALADLLRGQDASCIDKLG